MIFILLSFITATPTYTLSGPTLTIKGTGEVTQEGVRGIAYSLVQVCHVSEGITILKSNCFQGCSSLVSIELPASLKKIEGCFSSCSKLKEITIPEGVEEIATYYLMYSSLLFERYIVDSNNIKFSTFDGCLYSYDQTQLYSVPCSKTSISFAPNIKTLTTWAFTTTYIKECHFTSTISTAAYQTFVDNKNVINVTFSPLCSITSIPGSFFHQTNIHIFHCPPNVTTLSTSIFYGCSIPEFTYMEGSKLTTLVLNSFLRCTSLTTVRLPNTIRNINPQSFSQCPKLCNIIIDSSNPYIYSNGNCIYANENRSIVFVAPSADEISILDTTIEIGSSLLQKCESLKLVTIEGGQNLAYYEGIIYSFDMHSAISALGGLKIFKIHNKTKTLNASLFANMEITEIIFDQDSILEEIQNYCFDSCKIKNFVLPLSVKTIGQWSFLSSNITSIEFGSQLSTINGYAFSGCTSLKSIIFDPDCPLKLISTSSFAKVAADIITFPNNLETIQNIGFESSQLVSIYMSDSIKTIGTSFTDCSKLKMLYLMLVLFARILVAFNSNILNFPRY